MYAQVAETWIEAGLHFCFTACLSLCLVYIALSTRYHMILTGKRLP